MTYDPAFPSEPPTADPTVDPSSTESPAATTDELANAVASARLGGVLAGRSDLETWTPGPEDAQQAINDVAAYCRDYCPARLSCGEEACRLWRLEERAAAVLSGDSAGVLEAPIVGIV